MGAPVYQVEDYLEVIHELKALYPEHWEEVALDKDAIKLEPDYETYALLAKVKVLHLVTMRVDGELAGYHISLVHPHLHYLSSLTAFTDIFFVRKKNRVGLNGYRLLKFVRDSLFERGVQKIYMGEKDHIPLGPVLKRLGFRPIERLWTQTRKVHAA